MIVWRCACIVVRLHGTQFIKVKFAGDVVAIDNLDKICLVPRGFVALCSFTILMSSGTEKDSSLIPLYFCFMQ